MKGRVNATLILNGLILGRAYAKPSSRMNFESHQKVQPNLTADRDKVKGYRSTKEGPRSHETRFRDSALATLPIPPP